MVRVDVGGTSAQSKTGPVGVCPVLIAALPLLGPGGWVSRAADTVVKWLVGTGTRECQQVGTRIVLGCGGWTIESRP